MSHESWEKYVNTGSTINPDENTRQFHDNGNEIWHTDGRTLQQNYNEIRASEIKKREEKIFHKVIHFYFSRNVVIVVLISIILCLITSTFSLEGLFFWNILLVGIVWGYYQVKVRTRVRPEWDEVWEEIDTI
jgi:hypothetical protein